MTELKNKIANIVPDGVRRRIEPALDAVEMVSEMRDPRVFMSLGPSAARGLLLKRGKQGVPTKVPAHHSAHFDWTYPQDQEEMRLLYSRAKEQQWDAERDIDWSIPVDPLSPDSKIVPDDIFNFELLEEQGITLNPAERTNLLFSLGAWSLSQFLHGEQGALFAAAQVTEAVQFFDGKLYGATQVMDEARHVEVFHRYLDTKMEKLYYINDNLFVVIDALMSDSRWDMKFLGMQIMVEGHALGAFGSMYRMSAEPLLRSILKRVIMDEARHVHYGVLALREHIRTALTESERREREDWCFEVALLMRNRLFAHEVYEEWFAGRLSKKAWTHIMEHSKGFADFRHVMFHRLVPNLRDIGLMSDRIIPDYQRVGLMQYYDGRSATELDGATMITELDEGRYEKPPELALVS
jgi:hypothetical protein